MKPIQAVFFDVDGTLYDNAVKQFPASLLPALNKLRAKGIKICINTGRLKSTANNIKLFEYYDWEDVYKRQAVGSLKNDRQANQLS